MKNLSLVLIFLLTLSSCKKDAPITDVSATSDSIALRDSVATDSSAVSAQAFKVDPINQMPEKGKTIFLQNDNVLFYFSTRKNLGSIQIDGKTYDLDQLNFIDNEYYISGENISITAKEGLFAEMTGDCLHGTFPEVNVELDGKTVILNNIKVHDCPSY